MIWKLAVAGALGAGLLIFVQSAVGSTPCGGTAVESAMIGFTVGVGVQAGVMLLGVS